MLATGLAVAAAVGAGQVATPGHLQKQVPQRVDADEDLVLEPVVSPPCLAPAIANEAAEFSNHCREGPSGKVRR